MSTHATTAVSTPTGDGTTSAVDSQAAASRSMSRRNGTPLPLTRLVSVELRKNFDTRSGRWLLVSLGGAAVLTTGAIIAWTPAEQLTFSQFTLAIGVPMTVILPPHHRAVGDHGVESALRASHLHPRSASRPRPAGQGHRRGPGRRARHSGGLRCRRTGEHGWCRTGRRTRGLGPERSPRWELRPWTDTAAARRVRLVRRRAAVAGRQVQPGLAAAGSSPVTGGRTSP
jgi:hypothetical protein